VGNSKQKQFVHSIIIGVLLLIEFAWASGA